MLSEPQSVGRASSGKGAVGLLLCFSCYSSRLTESSGSGLETKRLGLLLCDRGVAADLGAEAGLVLGRLLVDDGGRLGRGGEGFGSVSHAHEGAFRLSQLGESVALGSGGEGLSREGAEGGEGRLVEERADGAKGFQSAEGFHCWSVCVCWVVEAKAK